MGEPLRIPLQSEREANPANRNIQVAGGNRKQQVMPQVAASEKGFVPEPLRGICRDGA